METAMNGMITARVARLAVALIASTAVVAVAAGTASAAVTKTHFTAAYTFTELTGGGFGSVSCEGNRIVNTKYANKGWPTETRDVERCKSTESPRHLIALTGGETGTWFPGADGWNSDYDGAAAVSAEYKVNSRDTSFRLVAYY
jgi:hypothetical protein